MSRQFSQQQPQQPRRLTSSNGGPTMKHNGNGHATPMASGGPNGPQHSGGPVGLHGGHGGHHAVGDNHAPVVGNGNGSLSPNGPNGGQTSLDRNNSSLDRNNSSLDRNNRDASGDIYRQLIDSSDLVKELDDIEAISQQISQHAEVLYQNWKSNSQPRTGTPTTPTSPSDSQQQKVASSSTTYGAGVGFPKRSILENGVSSSNKNGGSGNNSPTIQSPTSPTSPGVPGLNPVVRQSVSPLSSPTATLNSPSFINKSMPKSEGQQVKIDLMPPPEVNGNLKDLVNSFVSTDRAKQAARQTISSTITNQMNKRNNFRSPSPTSTSTTSSPFSSRGVSPLRSPMLVQPAPPERRLMDAFPTNASIMNSVHTKMPPMFNNEESQNKRAVIANQQQQHQHNQQNHQQPSPISFQHQQESPSDPHQNLIPLQSKTSNSVGNSSGNGGEAVGIPIIRIPIQHQQSSSGSNGSSTQNQNKESLKSPLVLNTALSIPTTSQSSGASPGAGPGGPGNPVGGPGLIPGHPVPHQGLSELRTSASFGGTTSIPTLHAAHVDTMKKRFEEAKERINAMHQRAAAGQPFPFLSPPGAPNIDPFTDELDFFSRIRSRPQRPLIAPPHPELTPQQKQHISERSSAVQQANQAADMTGLAGHQNHQLMPHKRFGGSVADRVMLFERHPVPIVNNENSKETRTSSGNTVAGNSVPVANNNSAPPWKNLHQEGVGKVQTPRTKAAFDGIHRHARDIPIVSFGNSGLPSASAASSAVLPSLSSISSSPSATPTPLATSSSATPSATSTTTPSLGPLGSSALPTAGLPTTPSHGPATAAGLLGAPSHGPAHAAHPAHAAGGGVATLLVPAAAPVFSSPILTPNSRASSASTSPASTLSRVSRPPSIIVTGKEKVLPKFHFPLGNPASSPSGDLTKFADEFRKHKNSCVTLEELGQILKACGYPLYWKGILFSAAGGDKTGLLSYVAFSDFWRKMCGTHHDEAAQIMHILTFKNPSNRKGLLAPEDFVPLVQDVVDTHPGLGFLKEATEFHSRYVHTVIARIFFVVNRSWSGFITLSELRRSNLLGTLRVLQEEDDVNQITDFFSYEHFYVIYCKFWELDKDHDLFIDREDLARHNDHAISARMIDRIFSGAVTRGAAQQEGKMSYTEFVWFLLAEEDKRAATSIEYWFRCMDLDGDGYLSMYELEYFYEEQLQRMEQLGIETLPFEDCLCQMLDMIMPKKRNVISLQDMKRCRMTPIFFDTFFNLEKYLDHEQRDPFASNRDVDEDGNECTDWDRFAAEEYELLVAEEGNTEGMDEMCYEDDPDGNAEMQLEQALDENDLVYHDTMIAANS